MDVKLAAVIFLGAIGTGRAYAGEKIQVDVYVQPDNWVQSMRNAEWLASKIFEAIDVSVTWHAGELPAVPSAGRRSIGIRMVEHAPASLSPYSLASARPYGSSGSLITVYEDRVRPLVSDSPSLSHVLLGYIFVHELAHVMQGHDHHSDSGILKAHWSIADHNAMRAQRLGFTDNDSEQIRAGLTVRLAAR